MNNKSDPQRGLLRDKEIVFMKRIMVVFGIVAVMAAMMVTLAAPAMADNNRQENRQDRQENRQDRQENRQNNWFNNHHDSWFDHDRDNVNIRLVSESDFDGDFDHYNPNWYLDWYDDCGFDWDGPVTPVDCWY
jgi:type II secretory pathway pseudopilin PulG